MARPPSGVPLSPQITRRDFMKTLLGAAASAAVPGVPLNTSLIQMPGAAKAQPQFITDPKIIQGFSGGMKTMGGEGARVWLDDSHWYETDGMQTDWIKEGLRQMHLDEATAKIPRQMVENSGPYEWNYVTKQWHPVARFKPNPNIIQSKYLQPGSPIPEDSVSMFDGWGSSDASEWEHATEFYRDPLEFGQQMMDAHYREKMWEAQRKGPDKEEMKDPEYRDKYIEHATKNRLAPGGKPETPRSLMDSGLPTGNVAIPGADDAGSLPSMIGRLRRIQKPAATGIMSLAPALLAPQGEEQ